jgi:hypothetical protein
VVDGWPLIGEPDQVVGPIVPIQRKRIGRFGYPAMVLGRSQFVDFGSSFGQGFSEPKGKNDMSLLAACSGTFFWHETKAKAT